MMMIIGTETVVTQLENERSRVHATAMPATGQKIYVHYIERHWNMVHPSNGCVSLSFIMTQASTAASFYCSLPIEAEVHTLESTILTAPCYALQTQVTLRSVLESYILEA